MRGSSNLAKYLRHSRKLAGYTQDQVAKACRYSTPQFVSNWERGVSAPPVETLQVLCVLYYINPNDMIAILVKDYKTRLEKALQELL